VYESSRSMTHERSRGKVILYCGLTGELTT